MTKKWIRALACASIAVVGTVVPVFAANPAMGDNFNMALGLGLGGGALVLIAAVLFLTKKKRK